MRGLHGLTSAASASVVATNAARLNVELHPFWVFGTHTGHLREDSGSDARPRVSQRDGQSISKCRTWDWPRLTGAA